MACAAFLDIETSGLDARIHEPIEIALKIIALTSGDVLASYHSFIQISESAFAKADVKSMQINGIQKKQLEGGKSKKEVCQELIALFTPFDFTRGKAVFICQNPSFDRAFFAKIIPVYWQEEQEWPYHWLDLASMYWAKVLLPNKLLEPFDLSKDAIAKHFGLPPEEKPHGAERGVEHLIDCYQKII